MKDALAFRQKNGERIPIRILLRDRQGNTEDHTIYAGYGENLLDVISRNFDVRLKSNELGMWITAICGKKVRISEDMQGGIQGYVNNTLPYVVSGLNPLFLGFHNIAVTHEFELRMQYDPYLQDIQVPLSVKVKAIVAGLQQPKKEREFDIFSSCSASINESMRKSLSRIFASHEMMYFAVDPPASEGIAFVSIYCNALPEFRPKQRTYDQSHLINHMLALEIAMEKASRRIDSAHIPIIDFPYSSRDEKKPASNSEHVLDDVVCNATLPVARNTAQDAAVELSQASSTMVFSEAKTAVVNNQQIVPQRPSQKQSVVNVAGELPKMPPFEIFQTGAEIVECNKPRTKTIAAIDLNRKVPLVKFIWSNAAQPKAKKHGKQGNASINNIGSGIVAGLKKRVAEIKSNPEIAIFKHNLRKGIKIKQDRAKVRQIRDKVADEIVSKVAEFAKPNDNRRAGTKAQGKNEKIKAKKRGDRDVELIFAFDKASKIRLKRVARNRNIWQAIRASVKRVLRLL